MKTPKLLDKLLRILMLPKDSPKTQPNEEACRNCKFFRSNGYGTFCYNRAPVGYAIGGNEYSKARVDKAWPKVNYNDWCGDWEDKNKQ